MTEALGDSTIDSLRLNGAKLKADLIAGVTAADIERTIEGASTLTIVVRDTHRTLLKSGIFGSRSTMQVDRYSFELAGIRKSGHDLSMVFEDLAVAAMRRHDAPRKIDAGKMTRVQFCKLLIAEEPWIKVVAPVSGSPTKIEVSRGTVATADQAAEKETTWDATGRLMDEVGWRRFVRDGAVWLTPETQLIKGDSVATLSEYGQGVDFIDFDFDIGKPIATATAVVRASLWQAPPGSAVSLKDVGPATGKWLVSSITRSLFKTTATINLAKARPVLPEPAAPPKDTSAVDASTYTGPAVGAGNAGVGSSVSKSAVSSEGFIWPVSGKISSGFGTRNGRLHAGIDIAVPVGTPVSCSKDGVVSYAGTMSGYGNVIIILSDLGMYHRYGHVSRIEVRRGQQVKQGERIGLSGGAKGAPGSGDSTGPHVHFEIRPGDKPDDPAKYLPAANAAAKPKPPPPPPGRSHENMQ